LEYHRDAQVQDRLQVSDFTVQEYATHHYEDCIQAVASDNSRELKMTKNEIYASGNASMRGIIFKWGDTFSTYREAFWLECGPHAAGKKYGKQD
jgi:hypothetical protein